MVGLIFLFPETRWPRVHAIDHQATEEKVGEYDVSHAEPLKSATAADSQHSEGARPEPELGVPVQDLVLGKGRPSRSQLMPWSISEDPVKTTLIELWLPWKMAVFPIVELAAFIIGWSSSSYLTTNLTQSEVFAAPPYGFSSQKIGLFNLAPMIGALIGLATNGYYSDWLSMRATVKNRYIREPEMRLPAMLPYAVIAIISNFVIAFGYQYKWDWKVSLIRSHRPLCTDMCRPPDHRHHWLHHERHPGCRHPLHHRYIRRGQLQTGGGQSVLDNHRRQSLVVLRSQQVVDAVHHTTRLCEANHAEHVSLRPLAVGLYPLLLPWQDLQKMDGRVKCTSGVTEKAELWGFPRCETGHSVM